MKRRSIISNAQESFITTVKRKNIQAQRKFAQGTNNYMYSPSKANSNLQDKVYSSQEPEDCEINNFSTVPTVDDFLTFLCFRETEVLPERLNYLNQPQFDNENVSSSYEDINSQDISNDNEQKSESKSPKEKKKSVFKLRSRSLPNTITQNHYQKQSPKFKQHPNSTIDSKIFNHKSTFLKEEDHISTTKYEKNIPERMTRRSSSLLKNNDVVESNKVNHKSRGHKETHEKLCINNTNIDNNRMTRSRTPKISDYVNLELNELRRSKRNKSIDLCKTKSPKKIRKISKNCTHNFNKNIGRKEKSDCSVDTPIVIEDIGSTQLKKIQSNSTTHLNETDHEVKITDHSDNCSSDNGIKIHVVDSENSSISIENPFRGFTNIDSKFNINENTDKDKLTERANGIESKSVQEKLSKLENIDNDEVGEFTISVNNVKKIDELQISSTDENKTFCEPVFIKHVPELRIETHINIKGFSDFSSPNSESPSCEKLSVVSSNKLLAFGSDNIIKSKELLRNVNINNIKREKNCACISEESNKEKRNLIVTDSNKSINFISRKKKSKILSTKSGAINRTNYNGSNKIVISKSKVSSIKLRNINKRKQNSEKNPTDIINTGKKNRSIVGAAKNNTNQTIITKLEENDKLVLKNDVKLVDFSLNDKYDSENNDFPGFSKTMSLNEETQPNKQIANDNNSGNFMKIKNKANDMKFAEAANSISELKSIEKHDTEDHNTITHYSVCKSPLIHPHVELTDEKNKFNVNIKSSSTKHQKDIEKKIFKKSLSFTTHSDDKSQAFSPENEKSVYAFEPDLPTTSLPFRRSKSTTPTKQASPIPIMPELKSNENDIVTPAEVTYSAPLGVRLKVNDELEEPNTTLNPLSSIPITIKQNEVDEINSTHVETSGMNGPVQLFYIPIPTTTTLNALGVTVKLGTATVGSNQKIIMHASLVTSTPMFETTTVTTTYCALSKSHTTTSPSYETSQKVSSVENVSKKSHFIAKITNRTVENETIVKPKVQSVKILKLKKKKNHKLKKIVKPTSESSLNSPLANQPNNNDGLNLEIIEKTTEKSLNVSKNKSDVMDHSKHTSLTGVLEDIFENEDVKEESKTTQKNITSTHDVENSHSIINEISNPSQSMQNKNVHDIVDSKVSSNEPKHFFDDSLNCHSETTVPTTINNYEKNVEKCLINNTHEAPTYYPAEEEFNDPLEYIEKIKNEAEKYGLCRIIPPSTFRPECKVNDSMRFTAYNHYIHKMLYRWGPNVKEMISIRKFLTTQNIKLTSFPKIGGIEVDLPQLYGIVQQCGGLREVMENNKWHIVADIMKIPKVAQDRVAKLDDIYCKYLLPYDILSHDEREKLFKEVEEEWNSHFDVTLDENNLFEDADECITKGKTMALSCYYRTARNTVLKYFGNCEDQKPTIEKIEEEFWRHVSDRKSHVCVHSGSVDSGSEGYGFSISKNSAFRKHPWNFKMLTTNNLSILKSLGPILGVTVPTLHFGMLYSTSCWYRDPHGLPWIEYLHNGASKIWYGIAEAHSDTFESAMRQIVPKYCKDKKIWLPADTVMVPPHLLTSKNVPLSRIIQEPGQFIVVFPKAFTSSISTGYLVSEIIYFADTSWLDNAKEIFEDIDQSAEPPAFSPEQLLVCMALDTKTSLPLLEKILPWLEELVEAEIRGRRRLKELCVNKEGILQVNMKRKQKLSNSDDIYYHECEICHANLFLSKIEDTEEELEFCLKHAINLLQEKPDLSTHFKLLLSYTEVELNEIIIKTKNKIEIKNGSKRLAI